MYENTGFRPSLFSYNSKRAILFRRIQRTIRRPKRTFDGRPLIFYAVIEVHDLAHDVLQYKRDSVPNERMVFLTDGFTNTETFPENSSDRNCRLESYVRRVFSCLKSDNATF